MASVDKIVIKVGGSEKTLTPAQWKALPITERVKYLGGDITFFGGGQRINSKEAVAQLR